MREARTPEFSKNRFETPDENADELSGYDARVVVSMDHGYATWPKYASYLHLDPAVREVIAAVQAGDLGPASARALVPGGRALRVPRNDSDCRSGGVARLR